MRRVLVVMLVALIVAAGVLVFLSRAVSEPVLADPDCEDAPYVMAFNLLSKELRRDDIGVMDEKGRITRLTKDHASFDPSFSPEGRSIAFVSGRDGFHDECCGFSEQAIFVMNVDGSGQRRLTNSEGFDQAPVWSPDGAFIAFSRRGAGIMVAPASGGEAELVFEHEAEIYAIDWSSDGERLAFGSGRESEAIHVVDRDGSNHEVVAEDLVRIDELAWSPDGKSFAFGDWSLVYTLSFEEPNPRLLTREGGTPAWSPDGNHIAYLAEGEDFGVTLWAEPAGGGKPVQLSAEGENLYPFERDLDWLDCSQP